MLDKFGRYIYSEKRGNMTIYRADNFLTVLAPKHMKVNDIVKLIERSYSA